MNTSREELDETGNASTTMQTIDSFYFYETEQFTVLWFLFVIIVAGNSGVLVTLYASKPRKSRMNFFIRHLAIADLLVGMISVLTDIVWRTTVVWYAGNVACKLIKFLQVAVTYGSTYVLVALSIDRYDAIRHPMKFSGSWKRAKFLIIAAWVCSLLFSTPILILYEEKTIQGKQQCWIDFPQLWHWQLYMCVVSVSLFLLPAAIIAGCYAFIILTIWSKSSLTLTSKRTDGLLRAGNSRRVSSRGLIPRAKVKTIKITLVIVSVFILCWSPYIVFDLLQVFGFIPQTQSYIAVATFVQSLAPLNSAANPIIYCIFSTRFCNIISSWSLFRKCECPRLCKKSRKDMAANAGTTLTATHTRNGSLSDILTSNSSSAIMRRCVVEAAISAGEDPCSVQCMHLVTMHN